MVPFAIAPSFGNAGASVVAGCLSLVLSLAPLLPGSAPRLEEAAFAARTQDDPTGIALNEFMPDPNSDWNGDGTMSDASDEYVELYNDGSVGDVDLAGWKLDDIAGGGSSEYVFPPNTILQTGGYLVVFSADTRIALNNIGDTVRLVRPDNSEADTRRWTMDDGLSAIARRRESAGVNPDADRDGHGNCAPRPNTLCYADAVVHTNCLPQPDSGAVGYANPDGWPATHTLSILHQLERIHARSYDRLERQRPDRRRGRRVH